MAEDKTAKAAQLPQNLHDGVMVVYRSIGLGLWGGLLRVIGMPLEKIANEANSGRVSNQGSQLRQAVQQVYARGWADPFLCITPRSLVAWFLQYGMMGFTFQLMDLGMARALQIPPQPVGHEVFEPKANEEENLYHTIAGAVKGIGAPLLTGVVESSVANKAECERYLGPSQLKKMMGTPNPGLVSRLRFASGPAFMPNMLRNFIMAEVSFVATPILFQAFPAEHRTANTLFWFGLSLNLAGNVVAIATQSLWGRSLDHLYAKSQQTGLPASRVGYPQLVRGALQKDGVKAFVSPAKWFTRVLMNAPAQGTIPWFNNVVLPIWEPAVLRVAVRGYQLVGGK